MKNFLFAIFTTIVACCSMPGATDVSGKWSGFPIYLTLKQDGSDCPARYRPVAPRGGF
jgi:hypothetical protein